MPVYDVNIYLAYLQAIEFARSYRTLDEVMRPLGEAVLSIGKVLEADDLEARYPDHADLVVEQGVEAVESLLGAAFVTCQAHLQLVSSRVLDLRRYAAKEGTPFSFGGDKKHELYALSSAAVENSGRTEIELINAGANYFKHHSEWTGKWKCLTGSEKHTAAVLLDCGIQDGSGAVLREVAALLGNSSFAETRRFSKVVWQWHIDLEDQHRRELSAKGLIGGN